MKKLLVKMGIFLCLIVFIAIIALLLPVLNKGKASIHYSIIDKHQMLDKPTDRQRLVLLGGSNVGFGIYSPLIEEKFQVDVINLGIHAGYGLKYIIDDYKNYARENDIVLLIPEYSFYLEKGLYGEFALVQGLNVLPSNIQLLNVEQALVALSNLPKHCIKKIGAFGLSKIKPSKGPFVYNRNSFNEYGDVVAHWGVQQTSLGTVDIAKGRDMSDATINYIREFSEFVNANNGLLFLSYPCLNRTTFERNDTTIRKIEMQLQTLDIELIGTPSRYSLPDSLHFDTHYHLIKEGQIERTERLIHDLEKYGLQQLLKQQ